MNRGELNQAYPGWSQEVFRFLPGRILLQREPGSCLLLFWRVQRGQDSDLCACDIYMIIMLQWINTLEWTIVSLQATELWYF